MDSAVVDEDTADMLSLREVRQWMKLGLSFLKIFSVYEFSEQEYSQV
jgi:hypothetical protein